MVDTNSLNSPQQDPKFPGEFRTIGGINPPTWEYGRTRREINRINATQFYTPENVEYNHPELHKFNPYCMLYGVPFIRGPNKMGEDSWKYHPMLTKLYPKEQDRVKRLAYYKFLNISSKDDDPNPADSLEFPYTVHRSYLNGIPVYVQINENSPDVYSYLRPPRTSNIQPDTDWFTEILNYFLGS